MEKKSKENEVMIDRVENQDNRFYWGSEEDRAEGMGIAEASVTSCA